MEHHFTPFDQLFLPPKEILVPAPERIAPVEQLPPPRIIWLDEAESTHMLLKTPQYADLQPFTMVAARRQTCGRGQRGNSWESEDFKNLTFSLPANPTWLHPAMQFALSESVALAVAGLLREYGIETSVKWPNDIYAGHRKICGILIDHSLQGDRITRSIISAGLNVNQLRFFSDAPNPVSMLGLMPSGTPDFDLDAIARRLQQYICHMVGLTSTAVGRDNIHKAFMQRLYLNDGESHHFHDCLCGTDIRARIADVAPDGLLTLRLDPTPENPDGELRSYRFKEVAYILPSRLHD